MESLVTNGKTTDLTHFMLISVPRRLDGAWEHVNSALLADRLAGEVGAEEGADGAAVAVRLGDLAPDDAELRALVWGDAAAEALALLEPAVHVRDALAEVPPRVVGGGHVLDVEDGVVVVLVGLVAAEASHHGGLEESHYEWTLEMK